MKWLRNPALVKLDDLRRKSDFAAFSCAAKVEQARHCKLLSPFWAGRPGAFPGLGKGAWNDTAH
jgi:hypothetical protein